MPPRDPSYQALSIRIPLSERMRIAADFVQMVEATVTTYIGAYGDTAFNRNRGLALAYRVLATRFATSKSTIRLHIRCFEKFSNNVAAIETLTFTDMVLLVGNHIGPDVVEMIISARRQNPNLSRREVQSLLANHRP